MTDKLTLAGQKVHSIGYGLMGLTWRADPPSQEQAFSAMKEALHQGANCWNGGEIYGTPERNSLHLLREYFNKYPEDASKVVVSIKGGYDPIRHAPVGTCEYTHKSIQNCIDILGADLMKRGLWEAARVDPHTPIEVTMRAAKEFVDAGKLGGISLSECSAETIRRAAKVAKIEAVEVEFSLWATEILDNGVAATCAELGIPIIGYSPLGRGFLTGQIRSLADIPEHDLRRRFPRFSAENFPKNVKLVDEIKKVADRKGATPGQVAMAWVKCKSGKNGLPRIIPIPGASTPERVRENMKDIELSVEDVREIDDLTKSVEIKGGRYPDVLAALNFGNSPPEMEDAT